MGSSAAEGAAAPKERPSRQPAISIYGGNPCYWQYGGRPLLLLGGSVEDDLFQIEDVEGELDALTAAGGNYVRCTMSSRDTQIWPFARTDQAYNLRRPNPEFWHRFGHFLAAAQRRDVIVQVEVWATFDYYDEQWLKNPFNPANNVNYSVRESGLPPAGPRHNHHQDNPFFYSVPGAYHLKPVLAAQERFVNWLLDHSLAYGNVLYCMDNETATLPLWAGYWIDFIQARAEAEGRHVYTGEMWLPKSMAHPMHQPAHQEPDRYRFVEASQNSHHVGETHYENALLARQQAAWWPRPVNNVKIYGAGGGPFGEARDAVRRFWQAIFAGHASARFHRPPAGLGLAEPAQKMIRAARTVTDAFDLVHCRPAPDLVRKRTAPVCLLADPGRCYGAYLPAGGSATLNLAAAQGRGEPLALRWFAIDEGGWHAPAAGGESLAAASDVRLQCPGSGQWAAVIT